MTFRTQIHKKKFGKKCFRTLSHRPLTNTSSLKIAAAYWTYSSLWRCPRGPPPSPSACFLHSSPAFLNQLHVLQATEHIHHCDGVHVGLLPHRLLVSSILPQHSSISFMYCRQLNIFIIVMVRGGRVTPLSVVRCPLSVVRWSDRNKR